MIVTVGQIAGLLNGTVEGDDSIEISGPSKIEEGTPGTLTFLANGKYEKFIYSTSASAILVDKDFTPSEPLVAALIRVENVYESIGLLLKWYEDEQRAVSRSENNSNAIHETAEIAENVHVGTFSIIEAGVKIGQGTTIHQQVFIGANVKIGTNCTIYPGARIMHATEIGNNCTIHPNAVIGSDGFGYSKNEDGYTKIPQIGKVVLEDNVDVGANTVIDRATMGVTLIKKGVKLDNLIQIAHNVTIDEHTAVAAQAGIAGSTFIGKHCILGGQAGIAGHISMADNTMIQAKTGIHKNIKEPGTKLYGYPGIDYFQYLRAYNVFKNLPGLEKQLTKLQRQFDALKNNPSGE